MISDFGAMISAAVQVMKTELTLWGHTFSMWNVFLFGMFVSIVIWVVWMVFIHD